MKEILKVKDVMKVYPNGVMACKDINFSALKGEIHAICGENGAGKSTLMKMLYGIEQPTSGQIYINGEEVHLTSSAKAIEKSIGMVHQHFMLVPSLTVAENVVLGIEPVKGLQMDSQKAVQMTEAISEKYNLKVSANEKVENLSVALKQRVEIIKALLKGSEILILDEPTTVLTPQETNELFLQLKELKKQGHTILFISHKLNEVKSLCDRITIMKAGKMIRTVEASDVSEADISRMMVGRDIIEKIDKDTAKPGKVLLRANNVTSINSLGKKILDGVSLNVKEGTILGLAGIEGNGQHELLEAISGMRNISNGTIKFSEEEISNKSIRSIRDLGITHIPEDRMTDGIAGSLSIVENVLAGQEHGNKFSGRFFLKRKNLEEYTRNLVQKFNIKCSNINQEIRMLSGGNIQKVVVAREFSSNPSLILVDQPTRGIDIGAAMFIRETLIQLRNNGKAILLNSADLNEVIELSDSIAVFHNGKIVAYFEDSSNLSEEELGLYMLGVKEQSREEVEARMNEIEQR